MQENKEKPLDSNNIGVLSIKKLLMSNFSIRAPTRQNKIPSSILQNCLAIKTLWGVKVECN